MSGTPTTPETPSASAPEAPQTETFSRDYVEQLRGEAAKYRTEKNSAVEAAKAEVVRDYEAKLAEKDTAHSEVSKTLADTSLELLKLKTVLTAKIPNADVLEVVELIQGDDAKTVSESVERVKALLGRNPAPSNVPAVDTTQGSGNHIPLNGDPVLEALKRAVGA